MLSDVKPYTTVVGVPAREAGKHVIKDRHVDLDHAKIIDPIKRIINELSSLRKRSIM